MKIYTVFRNWSAGDKLEIFECEGKTTKKGMKADDMHQAYGYKTFLHPTQFSTDKTSAIAKFIRGRQESIEALHLKIEQCKRDIEEAAKL